MPLDDNDRWLKELEEFPYHCSTTLCVYEGEGQEAFRSSWQPPWQGIGHQVPEECKCCGFVTIHEVRPEEEGYSVFCRYCGNEVDLEEEAKAAASVSR